MLDDPGEDQLQANPDILRRNSHRIACRSHLSFCASTATVLVFNEMNRETLRHRYHYLPLQSSSGPPQLPRGRAWTRVPKINVLHVYLRLSRCCRVLLAVERTR